MICRSVYKVLCDTHCAGFSSQTFPSIVEQFDKQRERWRVCLSLEKPNPQTSWKRMSVHCRWHACFDVWCLHSKGGKRKRMLVKPSCPILFVTSCVSDIDFVKSDSIRSWLLFFSCCCSPAWWLRLKGELLFLNEYPHDTAQRSRQVHSWW